MNVGEICNRIVMYANHTESVQRVAELMRKYHVGNVVITEARADGDGQNDQIPVGIVTDRDIVIEVVAKRIDPETVTAGDIMCDKLLSAGENSDLSETLEAMRDEGVRRVPVVNEEGVLVGILAIDDMLSVVATQLSAVAGIVGSQRLEESRIRE